VTFPTVQARNTTALASGTGARNHNLPASITAGDLLLLFICSTPNGQSFTATGWTAFAGEGGGSQTGRLLWKFPATGSEGTTVSVTQSGTGGVSSGALRISGSGGGLIRGTQVAAATNAPDPPIVQPGTLFGTGDHLYVEYVGGDAAQASATASASYGNLQLASNVVCMITAERLLTGNSDNPGAMSIATSCNLHTNTLAVQQSTPFYPWTRMRNYIRRRMRY